MKTNKVLAVALSAGLVLGGAYVADTNVAFAEEPAEKTLYDLDQDVQKAKEEKAAADAAVANKKEVIERVKAKEDTPQNQRRLENELKELEELEAKAKAAEDKVKAAEEAFNKKDAERKAEEEAEDKKPLGWLNASFQIKPLEGNWKRVSGAVIEVRNEKGEVVHTFTTEEERVETKLPEGDYTATVVSVPLEEGTYEWKEPMTQPVHVGPGSIAFHVYEKKKTQTLDDWQIEQNEKDGYFTEEDAKRAGELALDKAELRGLYEVEVRKNAEGDRWFWRFVPVEKAEEEKPGTDLTPLTPAEPIDPSTPWTPLTPADPIVPGGDNEVDLPGEKPEDKPEDNKGTEIEEEKPNEGKDKNEKAKPSKDKKDQAKPAKQKGNNPKTGLVGLAPIYSTLAISMAGIVAARKKND